jgi:polygalacturonase
MPKGIFLLAALSLAASFLTISNIEAQTATVFDVKNFGAHGDGVTLDTGAIQAAIDAANKAGGGVVLLSQGTYLSGSLHLKSHVDLRIEAGSTLLGSTSRSDYTRGRWYALLLANKQEDITISGAGTINGQGRQLAQDVIRRIRAGEIKDPMAKNRPDESQRPLLIEFRQCRNVRVSGVTLRDSSCWVENYIECAGLVIENIRVNSTAYWNNDGMDITDCANVRITGCDINSADDGICLKSYNRASRCENVEISGCRIRSSASAFKFGTPSFGGFTNVYAHDLFIYNTFRCAIALESVDGGALEDVRIENVQATNTGAALFMRLGHRDTNGPIGQLSNIIISNLTVSVPAGKPDAGYEIVVPPPKQPHNIFPSSIMGLPGHPVSNVILENVEINFAGSGRPELGRVPLDSLERIPEVAGAYPEFSMFGELPSWGLYVRHAQGLEFRNVRLRLEQPDFRPAMTFDDVAGLRLAGVDFGETSGEPVMLLDNVSETAFDDLQFPKDSHEKIRRLKNDSQSQ